MGEEIANQLKLFDSELSDQNKYVIQSFVVTTSKYDFSVYEKRVLYRVVEYCQRYIAGEKLSDMNFNIEIHNNKYVEFIMPISLLMTEKEKKNKKHSKVKDALRSLRERNIEFEKDGQWMVTGMITVANLDEKRGQVSFDVTKEVLMSILDFSKGYRKIELKTAMNFRSVYSMRMYELISGQERPLTYSLDKLRILFQLENKYPNNSDFIKKVIDTAKSELDKSSPYSFEYTLNKQGRRIVSINLIPKKIGENTDLSLEEKQLKQQMSIMWDISQAAIQYLKTSYLLTTKEIKNNLDLFKRAENTFDLLVFIRDIKPQVMKAHNPKGYLIQSIKNKLSELETNAIAEIHKALEIP